VPGFSKSVGGDGFLTFQHRGGGEYCSPVGRQPSRVSVSKLCQHRTLVAYCARYLSLYTSVDCEDHTQAACHRLPPTVDTSV